MLKHVILQLLSKDLNMPFRMVAHSLSTALILCSMVASVQAAGAAENGAAAIREKWAVSWNAGKPDQVASLYAPDAVFVTAPGDEIIGPKAIGSMLQSALTNVPPHLIFASVIAGETKDTAWDSGTYRETVKPAKGGAAQIVTGQYLILVHRSSDRDWLIERQAWTMTK